MITLTFAPWRPRGGVLNIPVRAVSQVRLDVGFQVAQGEESFLAK